MLYPFMQLNDGTEIVHSEAKIVDGKEIVRVVFETPVNGGFKHAECLLPDYKWEKIDGYSEKEITEMQDFIADLSAVIITFARAGGFDNANK